MSQLRRNGRISRRHLIRSGAAAALLAASATAARAEPTRRGILRLAAPGAGVRAADDPFGRLIAPGSVFDCLTEIGPDGRLNGELAEAWEPRGDASLWSVTLRDDAVFHDGRPFGAEDAVASLRFAKARLPGGTGIASVRKSGPHQVQITLDAQDPGFPFLLSDPAMVMLPAGDPEGALSQGIGTGLYRVSGPAGLDGLRLDRVPEHYKDGRAGWFEAVELLRIADPAERTEAMLAGRVDAVAAPDPTVLKRAGRGLRPVEVAAPSGAYLRISACGPNARVLAEAVKAGLDRDALLLSFLGGAGQVAADHPLKPAVLPTPDPERARHIFAQAGLDRAKVALGAGLRGMPGLDGLVRTLRSFGDAVGLTLAAADADPDLVISLERAQPSSDLALRRFAPNGLDRPDIFATRLAEARLARNSALRAEIHADLGQVLAREGLFSVPVFAHARFLHSARLTHLGHIGALDMLDSGRIAERWYYGSYG